MFKSIIKSALRSTALTITILYGAAIAPEAHNKFLRWKVGESVVQVLDPIQFGGGTGFAVRGASGLEYIMTNRHVCEVADNNVVRIKTQDGQEVYRKVVYRDDVHDLCLIKGIKGLAPLDIGSPIERGDHLYVVGHPGLRDLTTSTGEYVGRTEIELLFDVKTREECPGKVEDAPFFYQLMTGKEFICIRKYAAESTNAVIYGGNSGSPVVNRYGNIVAVAFAGSTQQERDNYLIPLRFIKRVLSKF